MVFYSGNNFTQGLALDIDETISWTVGYWIELLANKFGNPSNLSFEELADKYTYAQNVPYWQSEECKKYIEELRVDNNVYLNVKVIKDANKFVKLIDEMCPISIYLTTRPISSSSETIRWLNENNFPKKPVVFRPANVLAKDGNKWKASVLNELFPTINGIIDDNIGLLNFLGDDYKGKVFVYNSKNKNLDRNNIFACKNWEDVYKKVKLNI